MINAVGEIQDEAKRLKKRQDSCSSSKTIDPTDEYCNIGDTSLLVPPLDIFSTVLRSDY